MGCPKGWLSAVLIFHACTLALPISNPDLQVGLAITEITPPVGHPLAGYGSQRVAESVHQPLYAKALVLSSQGTTLALVSCDVHDLSLPGLVERLRRELAIDHVLLVTTHSHSAPNLVQGVSPSPWETAAEARLFDVVARALESRFVARVGSAQRTLRWDGTSAPESLCHNIRVRQDDGTIGEQWSVASGEGGTPTDPALGVVRIDDATGRTRVVLAHYSCQTAVLGPCNTAVSADYAGALCRQVERKLAGTTCVFLGGGGANVYPLHSRSCGADGFNRVQALGRRLGDEVLRTLEQIVPEEKPTFRVVQQGFTQDWFAPNPATAHGFIALRRGCGRIDVPEGGKVVPAGARPHDVVVLRAIELVQAQGRPLPDDPIEALGVACHLGMFRNHHFSWL